jgi:hypothetical protein
MNSDHAIGISGRKIRCARESIAHLGATDGER